MINHAALDIPNETLLALKVTADQASQAVLMAAAVRFFEMRRLSGDAWLADEPR